MTSIRTYEDLLQRCKLNPQSGCIEWQGYVRRAAKGNAYGYGELGYKGKKVSAHVLAYELVYGPVPKDPTLERKLCVCHKCDNRVCCNVDHLFVGTIQDNMADRESKGRGIIGERVARAVLTEHQVVEIKKLMSEGQDTDSLAAAYGVGRNAIRSIRVGRTWRHVPNPGKIDFLHRPSGKTHGSKTHPECTARGEMVANSKLVASDIQLIRMYRKMGMGLEALSDMFGVVQSHIHNICERKRWAHVPDCC